MAFGLGDVLQTLQQGVQALNNLRSTISTVFPQITATSTTAPIPGLITFTSSQTSMFILVTTSSGFTGKVPLYPQS